MDHATPGLAAGRLLCHRTYLSCTLPHHDADEAVQAGNDSYTLAIHGDPNSWWLCPGQYSEVNVVYKPDQNHGDFYDYDRCYPVLLKIVENSS